MLTTTRLLMMKRPTNSSREGCWRDSYKAPSCSFLWWHLTANASPLRLTPSQQDLHKDRFAGELSCFSSTEGWPWQGIWEEASSCRSWAARWRVWTSCQVGRRRCGVHCPRASRGPTDAWQAHTAPPSSYQPPFLLNLQIILNSVFCFGVPSCKKVFLAVPWCCFWARTLNNLLLLNPWTQF